MSANLLKSVIDIDAKAESIRAQAAREASTIKAGIASQCKALDEDLAKQIVNASKEIEAKEAAQRQKEIAVLSAAFDKDIASLKKLAEVQIDQAVHLILTKAQ